MIHKDDLIKIHDWLWEIPRSFRGDMRVPARVYASEKMLEEILRDRSLEQLANVATLPGIQKYAIVMPDAHEGYGFPIGGVAAFDAEEGVISPGGIGYDINCGVRLLRSSLTMGDVKPRLRDVGRAIYREVPSGVGRGGRLNLKSKDLDAVLKNGARQMIALGYGKEEDLAHIESRGVLEDADPEVVSQTAKSRGRDQLGTMGAGNHFVEVEEVGEVFDVEAAQELGLFKNQVVAMIHTGSRGLGHQVATDYIRLMMRAMPGYHITLPDRELACVPFRSREGQNYFHAMAAGANFAWANRELITWEVRKAWSDVFGIAGGDLEIVYDVSHNMAKLESQINADDKEPRMNADQEKNIGVNQQPPVGAHPRKSALVVHRKGATRAFPGQPVLIPGSMGAGSYVLLGEEKAMEQSFGSSCHGAGRRMSRTEAKRRIRGSALQEELEKQGMVINAGSFSGLAEEAPEAYKEVRDVVEVVCRAGIARKVAHLAPRAVIKG